jgi:hypothetical protein
MNNKNLRDSIKPEITTPICNDGTSAIHCNAGESEAGTSADKQEQPNDGKYSTVSDNVIIVV